MKRLILFIIMSPILLNAGEWEYIDGIPVMRVTNKSSFSHASHVGNKQEQQYNDDNIPVVHVSNKSSSSHKPHFINKQEQEYDDEIPVTRV